MVLQSYTFYKLKKGLPDALGGYYKVQKRGYYTFFYYNRLPVFLRQ